MVLVEGPQGDVPPWTVCLRGGTICVWISSHARRDARNLMPYLPNLPGFGMEYGNTY